MFKYGLDKVMDDVQALAKRMRSREEAADTLRQQASKIHARLLNMRQYQEEILNFNDFSKRTSDHRRGQLILCLSAENKQLEQLRMENKTLRNSLDEHQAALDMIMSKYRGQVSKLLHANQVEQLIQSLLLPHSDAIDGHNGQSTTSHVRSDITDSALIMAKLVDNKLHTNQLRAPKNDNEIMTNSVLTEQMATIAATVRDISDQGDAYANQLEEELHRLRSENSGLRELLHISNYNVDLLSDSTVQPVTTSAPAPTSNTNTDRFHIKQTASLDMFKLKSINVGFDRFISRPRRPQIQNFLKYSDDLFRGNYDSKRSLEDGGFITETQNMNRGNPSDDETNETDEDDDTRTVEGRSTCSESEDFFESMLS